MCGRADRGARVHALRGDDAVVARRELGRVGGRPEPCRELAGPGEPEAALVDRAHVRAVEVVRPDLDLVELREVRREERADGAAPDDGHADHAVSRAFTSRYIAVCSGTGTPSRSPSRTSAPVMKSTSVGRRARTSSSIDGTCAYRPCAASVSPRSTAWTFISHGSSWSSIPAAAATRLP